mmetsp:Transcript_51996/g.108603  ORF Transcript_51996/g.108603 Transcript_51996/m.108603 type:complete len:80 (+) Transcript_51996:100-339(+)
MTEDRKMQGESVIYSTGNIVDMRFENLHAVDIVTSIECSRRLFLLHLHLPLFVCNLGSSTPLPPATVFSVSESMLSVCG